MNIKRFALICLIFALVVPNVCIFADEPANMQIEQISVNDAVQNEAAEQNVNSFYVSVEGDDSNDGTIEKPFRPPERARDELRKIIANGKLPVGGFTVYIKSGVYTFPKTGFKLTDSDSGTEECPITYTSYGDENAQFVGGVTIDMSKFQRVSDEKVLSRIYDESARPFIYQYDLSNADGLELYNADQTSSNLYSNQEPIELICDEKVQTPARWPNKDDSGNETFTYVDTVVSNDPNASFSFKINDIYSDRMAYWKKADWKTMYMHGFFVADWLDSRVGVNNIRNNVISSSSSPTDSLKKGRAFYFYNLLPELDRPEEYFIDVDNKTLYYFPSQDATGDSTFILTTLKDDICTIDASNVTIKHITFNGSQLGGVKIGTAENSVIDQCKILNTDRQGVMIGVSTDSVDAVNCGIKNSEIRNVDVGLLMYAGDQMKLKKGNCYATNNIFENFARKRFCYDPAVTTGGCGNKILNNEIKNGPHMALWAGGCYNEIAYNDISDVLKETADSGAVYMNNQLICLGNEIHNNYFHDIKLCDRLKENIFGIRAFYFDDYTGGQNAYNNIIANVQGYGLLSNGGSWNKMNNNICYNLTKEAVVIQTGPEGDQGIFAQNSSNGRVKSMYDGFKKYASDTWYSEFPFLAGVEDSNIADYKGCEAKRNVAVDTLGFDFTPTIASKEKRVTENNIELTANEVFEDAENGDFRIKKNSKIYELIPDFEDIEFEKIGRYLSDAEDDVSDSIVIAVGEPRAFKMGKRTLIDTNNPNVSPIITEDRTLVPVRFIAESLGFTTDWNEETETVTLVKDNAVIKLKIGESIMNVNGGEKQLDTAPIVYYDRTLIPLRAVSEAVNKKVDWYRNGLIIIGDRENVFDVSSDKEKIDYLFELLSI